MGTVEQIHTFLLVDFGLQNMEGSNACEDRRSLLSGRSKNPLLAPRQSPHFPPLKTILAAVSQNFIPYFKNKTVFKWKKQLRENRSQAATLGP